MKKKIDRSFVKLIIIILLVFAISVNLTLIFGPAVKDGFTKLSCQLDEKEYVEGTKAGKAFCK